MTIGVILLAAGRARRMGHSKLTALVDGQPLIAHSLAAITAAGLPCLIVTGAHADAVHAALRPGIATTHAPDHADGQSASLRAGLAAAPDQWTGALIALGDMPLIQPATYAALATALAAASAVIPSYQGRPGNPAGFRRPLWPILMTLTGDRGARPLFGTTLPHPLDIPVNDPGILHDIDTPADLADLTRPDALRSPATAPRTPGSPRSPGRSR
ncbi:nucleotidyltransferase family protein [Sandaracinobacteroides saxicola]|uniref:Nucleotidyltransferase family protein n=1 Tax=Sandaracinobacteroides saxicola TaxID=2759707 RepID=A0A7G5IK46_9SPHN|nr:nucleotidyltransferase family protein [Sandaracinobacteroides saxicola]QMW23738.1 nucleotidyltransferase family protein [Sandaracinobacteroides saxicola]